ncbi:MAG: NAD-dependent DNA ligase LigA [Deltaproteobacteria bacterium]|nr:NAD-dependent DNA ligase LigA [Deltaproteobacteria bacterium]
MTSAAYEKWPQARLEREVQRHNQLYFVAGRPEISDAEFDRMVEVLRRRFPDSAALQAIGSDAVGERAPVRHAVPMLSLDKCYQVEDLNAWAEKLDGPFVVSPKVDGVACALRYDMRGQLVLAATRGNGQLGEDVTPNARVIAGIPTQLPLHDVEVRGEVYLPLSTFRERFAASFMSPRNLAAGALKQKDPGRTGECGLRFFAYDLLGSDAATEQEKRRALQQAGFSCVTTVLVTTAQLAAQCALAQQISAESDFETDGIVFKIDDVGRQQRLGATAHHPRFAIAYKFAGDAATTTLREIVWNVSRNQIITPIGLVEPVELSGATVSRVTLHNYGLALRNGVGPGAAVIVRRRGGVIPHLESVVEPGAHALVPPPRCPSCAAATRVEGDFVYCTNPTGCSQAVVGALKHFLEAIDCDGFGPKVLQQLVEQGLAADPADLFALTAGDLLSLERMGEVLAHKLVAHLHARRELPLDVLLRSLGIPDLARQTARILASFGTLSHVLALTEDVLAAQHGIGPIIATAIVQGLKARRPLIDKLQRHVTIVAAASAELTGPLSGRTVLFTGSLQAMARNAAHQLVESRGGRIASGVSTTLDYLVVGSAGGAGSKLKKAHALVEQGAPLTILTEEAFFRLVQP